MLTRTEDDTAVSPERPSWLKRALRIEWLGQTIASLSWIASVFTYGISATGDWLQLIAASAWLVANIAAIAKPHPAEPLK
tara:strand:- start:261 stop:500 length:240 start_codon:yes stop_codon:yes gene_type:complete